MKEYTREELDEKELEDRVRQAPYLIEDGLRFVDHQRKTERGPLDVLLVDRDNTLVVAELKTQEDDGMLMQGLDYYDYISSNIEGVSRVYKEFKINPKQNPRLMLIAPSFTQLLINRCKWISEDIQISLYTYQKVVFKDDREDTIIYVPIDIPRKPELLIEVPSIEELIARIGNKSNEELGRLFLREIQEWDKRSVSLDRKSWGISIKYKGNVMAYWEPRKTGYQRISTYNEEGDWKGYSLKDKDDYERLIDLVKSYYKKLGGEIKEKQE